jgi:putative copper resistance protein D
MDGFGDHLRDVLAIVRAIHFASTSIVAGSLIFRLSVVKWSLRSPEVVAIRDKHIGLWQSVSQWPLLRARSGLQAATMSGLAFGQAMTADVLSMVVTGTQFGLTQDVRFVLGIVLAGCLTYDHHASVRWLGLMSAIGLISAIAWTGHAGAGDGAMGILHLTGDVLHLIGAGAWLGGLVSLTLLLAAVVINRCGLHAMRQADFRP